MSEIDDATLRLCQAGDDTSFARLVTTYEDGVYSLCTAIVGQDADDLAQETFLRVHRNIQRFEPNGSAKLSTWILTIARNLCRDVYRKRRTETKVPRSGPETAPETPEQHMMGASLNEQVLKALHQPPEEQRAIIALYCWQGLDYAEIAEVEGVPVGTVRSRLARARGFLAEALADEVVLKKRGEAR